MFNRRRGSISGTSLVFVFLLVTSIGCGLFLGINTYCMSRDVDSYIDRAQIAADREDMLEYLNKVKTNMKAYRIDHGHTAVIFKTPSNDLSLLYKSIERTTERLESIKSLNKSDTAYQVALDDIRGVIREIPNPSFGCMWAGYWFIWLVGGFACIICLFVFGVWVEKY